MIPLSFVNVATNIKFLEQSPSTRHFTGNDVPIYYLFIEELTPRIVGEAFYNGELENELRRIGKIDYLFKRDSDRERCMEVVEEVRCASLYPHLDMDCTDDCKKRG